MLTVATAIRDARAGGLRQAAKLLGEKGQLGLALELERLAEATEHDPIVGRLA